jgi:hypothetical protein
MTRRSARQRDAPDSLAVFYAIAEKGKQADASKDEDRGGIGDDRLAPLRLTSVASSRSSSSALIRTAGTLVSSHQFEKAPQRATSLLANRVGDLCIGWDS